jgi:hypothetical protein
MLLGHACFVVFDGSRQLFPAVSARLLNMHGMLMFSATPEQKRDTACRFVPLDIMNGNVVWHV